MNNMKPKLDMDTAVKIINTLSDIIDKEFKEQYETKYRDLLKSFNDDESWSHAWSDPYKTYSAYTRILTKTLHTRALEINPDLNKNGQFIFSHWDSIAPLLRNMIDTNVGCEVDRMRWVIAEYMKTCCDPNYKPPELKDEYYMPNFGTTNDWIKYIDAIVSLLKGKADIFMTQHNYMLALKEEKMKKIRAKDEILSNAMSRLKIDINRLREENRITQEEHKHATSIFIYDIMFEFNDRLLKNEYPSDEEIIAAVSKAYNAAKK